MIVKNCASVTCFETFFTEYVPGHTYLYDLGMNISANTGIVPSLQQCSLAACIEKHGSDENLLLNSSHFHPKSQRDNKTMSDINVTLSEKFSELHLESSDDTKTTNVEVIKSVPEKITVDSVKSDDDQKVLVKDECASKNSSMQPPVAKIYCKEKNTELTCLTCDTGNACSKKPEFNQKENKHSKNLYQLLTQPLIARSPDRRGRIHCKEGLPENPTKAYSKSNQQQKKAICFKESEVDIPSNSLSVLSSSQKQLHGNGGIFSEINVHTKRNEINSLHDFDQEFYLYPLLTPPESYTNSIYDQFSPSSSDYLSPSSVNSTHSYSGDVGISSPSLPYPTPPHSSFENSLFANDIFSSPTNDYISDFSPDLNISQFNVNVSDNSALKCPFEENLISTNTLLSASSIQNSSFSENTELYVLPQSSTFKNKKIKEIESFLKNGSVNPVVAQLVTKFDEHSRKTIDTHSSGCVSAPVCVQGTQKLNSQQTVSQCTKQPSIGILPPTSSVSCSAQNEMQNSENNLASLTQILISAPLQVIAVSEQSRSGLPLKNRPLLPKCEKREEERQPDSNECPMLKEKAKSKVRYKSVKSVIRSSMSREEKNQLFKLSLENQTEDKTKLHLAVIKGDIKLTYVIIESKRTMFRTNTLKSKSENLNSANETIQKFVNTKDNFGRTPLHYAVSGENQMLIAYLLECGADPFIKDNKNGDTPFHVATIRGDDAIISIDLLSHCRDSVVDTINNKGHSILMAAVRSTEIQSNGLKLVKHLLSSNHKLCLQDCEGKTALHIAVQKKDIELLNILLSWGTDVNRAILLQDNEGNTILHESAALTDIETETQCTLIHTIVITCPNLTLIKNKKGNLPYEMISENRTQVIKLLKVTMDELGFRNL